MRIILATIAFVMLATPSWGAIGDTYYCAPEETKSCAITLGEVICKEDQKRMFQWLDNEILLKTEVDGVKKEASFSIIYQDKTSFLAQRLWKTPTDENSDLHHWYQEFDGDILITSGISNTFVSQKVYACEVF